jgi:hypothetical protein
MTKGNTARVIRETPEHVRVLYEMLTYKRRDNSKTEEEFIETFIRPLGVEEDAYGNLYKVIGETPIVLWSSHTDTVHAEGGRQQLELTEDGWLGIPEDGKSNCLGADCGAGVWIMVNMIGRGVPGLYVFHRGEESGGQGSTYFAKHMLDKVAPDGIRPLSRSTAVPSRRSSPISGVADAARKPSQRHWRVSWTLPRYAYGSPTTAAPSLTPPTTRI